MIGPPRNAWYVDAMCADLVRRRRPPRAVTLPGRPQEVVVDLERSALVIVDMQNDFCAPDGWLHSIGVDIAPARAPIGPLNRLLPALRHEDVPVIWLNWGNRADRANLPPGVVHVYNRDGTGPGLGDPLPATGSPVLQRGSPSAAVVDDLKALPGDIHVDKSRMSGFFDTELDSVLRNLDASTVLFAGVNVDQCVMATLTDAACAGYDCVLLADCCGTTSPAYCFEATVYNVAQCFGFVASSADLVGALTSSRPQPGAP
jgi:nicotinamidase-related amidase